MEGYWGGDWGFDILPSIKINFFKFVDVWTIVAPIGLGNGPNR